MKWKHLTCWATFAALGLLTARSAFGQSSAVYFRGGIGPALTEQTDMTEFFGPTSQRVKFDAGVRLNLAGGFQVADWAAVELETGFLGNSIRSISGSGNPDAALVNVPFLVNGVFRFQTDSGFAPYVGVGAGFSTTVLSLDDTTINGIRLDGSESDLVFAGQVFAGFRYEFNDRMSVGAAYKFFFTGEPEWEVQGGGTIGFDPIQTHSLTAEFTIRF
jgi:opacity protein-like surface antigen